MVVEDQTLALAFLRDPKTHEEFASKVVTVETHISVIVLVGCRAFKLKRAVRLPYVDFSTAPKRLFACQRELDSIGELLRRYIAPFAGSPARRMAAWVSTDKALSSTLLSKWFGSMRKLFLTGWQRHGVH